MAAPTIVLLEHDERGEFARWSAAAAIVLAAHIGLAGTYLLRPPEQPQGAPLAPAVIIDLAPLPVAPASPVDLAPGPEMIESQPPPEPTPPPVQRDVLEPLPKIETASPVTLPPAEPTPAVEKPVEQKPVETKPPEPVRVERKPPAPRTSASPRSEHQTAPVTRAPSPGSARASAALASWRDRLVAHLQRQKRYPSGAESRREQGVVTLSFSVDRNGRLLGRHIARSSGYSELDQEVLAMIQRAQPLPPFPPDMPQARLDLVLPIRFSLR